MHANNSSIVPKRIVTEKSASDTQLVRNILNAVQAAKIEVVEKIPPDVSAELDTLQIVNFKGSFLKPCPGTKHYICCGYKILHFGEQCSVGCTYCILQAYFRNQSLRLFANWDQMLLQVEKTLTENPKKFYRIGTGEFTDSLLLDPITGFSKVIVPFFSRFSNAILELKTKTDHIQNLEGLEHGGNVIVAWSMNSPPMVQNEEGSAISIEDRIKCAKACEQWGFRLAFHFDPLIHYPAWEEDYGRVVDLIFKTVHAENIVWISLGCFRYMPPLRSIIEKKHPKSKIIYGEFIPGLDGKLRYFKEIRIEMYRKLYERIRMHSPDLCVYLCMEGEGVWKKAFGFTPRHRGGLPKMLDLAAIEKCTSTL